MAVGASEWEIRCKSDPQFQVLARHAQISFLFRAGSNHLLITVASGDVKIADQVTFNNSWDFTVSLPPEAWASFSQAVPPPKHTTLQSMLGNVEGVSVDGQRLKWAQHSALIERLLALARPGTAPGKSDGQALFDKLLQDQEITGRYLRVDIDGQPFRVYFETAGRGPVPLVFLHTAGSDSRQYKYLMIDEDLKRMTTMYAFDLPWHGRSEPPPDWMSSKYELSIQFYTDAINSYIAAIGLAKPVVLGCSMGGAIALYLASKHGERYAACIATEGGFGNPKRRVDWTHHPMINETLFVPSWVSGLIAPTTSDRMRGEILWEYSQGGPGVYQGDGYFYAFEMPNLKQELGPARCPLYVLSGEYDYSATPEMSREAAHLLGGKLILMEKTGHFPMSEEPERFARYVVSIINELQR